MTKTLYETKAELEKEIEINRNYVKIYLEKLDKTMSNKFKNKVLQDEANLKFLDEIIPEMKKLLKEYKVIMNNYSVDSAKKFELLNNFYYRLEQLLGEEK